ncbi:DNA polymerase III, delta prime subunit [Methylophilaceae bacterium 11]|jgi:DNA polymerase-3 subunit delta'|nr:DNA polymerase III, delta prime subunit [Methylophilaceae bacterium 11]
MKIYPWQQPIWQRIHQQKDRLSHALLLHGRAGVGKLDFAQHLSQSLLCAMPKNGEACDVCPQCTWFKEGAHPDFKYITPEDIDAAEDAPKKKTGKKTQISVDQIRQLIQMLSLTNHGVSSLRVVLIHPAEALNTASANALLKVLEEPPNNTIFILVTHQIHRLLPTILSRCQSIAMPIPERNVAIEWLAGQKVANAADLLDYHGGAPLAVLQMQADFSAQSNVFQQLAKGAKLDSAVCAGLLIEQGMEHAITLLQKWVFDLQLALHQLPHHYHMQLGKPLQALAKSVNLGVLLEFQRQLVQAKQTANHPLSQELQLENLLLQYKKAFKH